MNMQQLNPWNWFSHEQSKTTTTIPVKRSDSSDQAPAITRGDQFPMLRLHQEIDRLFNDAFNGFGLPSLGGKLFDDNVFARAGFEAKVNIASDDKNYHITLEAPGLTEKDLSLEVNKGVLSIRGEKKEESENKDKHFYRMERSYGSFQRLLSLPDDCDQTHINASMKNGLLDILIPRKAVAESETKRIPIN